MKRMMNIISKEGRGLWAGVYETREEAIAAYTCELIVEDQQCAECNAAPATRWYEDVTDNDGTGFLQVPVCDKCFQSVSALIRRIDWHSNPQRARREFRKEMGFNDPEG
jgi:uncharacterized C2H2 Zn-finger protein